MIYATTKEHLHAKIIEQIESLTLKPILEDSSELSELYDKGFFSHELFEETLNEVLEKLK